MKNVKSLDVLIKNNSIKYLNKTFKELYKIKMGVNY